MSRMQCARVVYLHARDAGITEIPKNPVADPAQRFFMDLLREAVPRVLFPSSSHGEIEFHAARMGVLEGRLDDMPDRFKTKSG